MLSGLLNRQSVAQPIARRVPSDDVKVIGQLSELKPKVAAVGADTVKEEECWRVPGPSLHEGETISEVLRSGMVGDASKASGRKRRQRC